MVKSASNGKTIENKCQKAGSNKMYQNLLHTYTLKCQDIYMYIIYKINVHTYILHTNICNGIIQY